MTEPKTDITAEPKKLTLDQVRARRAELAVVKAKADEASELERELIELQMDVDEAELRDKHPKGGIGFVRTAGGLVVLQRPRATDYQRFTDRGNFDNATVLQFVRPCVIHPDNAAFEALLREFPGVIGQLSTEAARLAGHKAVETAGK
jgi:hypothetical protein